MPTWNFTQLTFANVISLPTISLHLSAVDTQQLHGFVVVGDFQPDDGKDDNWPKWKDKTLPNNRGFSEIKLLGCEKGFGRIMMTWVSERRMLVS